MNVKLDFDIYRWKLSERIAFEKVAGMTCERAISLFEKAGRSADAALDIPTAVSAALVWIAARREDPTMTFEAVADTFTGEDFLDMLGVGGEEEAPLETEAEPTTVKSSAPSRTTSSTRQRKSSN